MKYRKEYGLCVLALISGVLFCGCIGNTLTQTSKIQDDQICFRIAGVNFEGNWRYLYYTGANTFNLSLSRGLELDESPFNLYTEIDFTDVSKPSLSRLDTTIYYILDTFTSLGGIDTIDFDTRFLQRIGDMDTDLIMNVKNENWGKTINKGTVNDLSLVYYNTNNPTLDITVDFTVTDNGVLLSGEAEKLYTYTSKLERVKTALTSFDKRDTINFVVLAEGYRGDQMSYYREYVRDAFASPAHFHFLEGNNEASSHTHITNTFFEKYWNHINVYMLETVSPHEGIDPIADSDSVMSILNMTSDKKSRSTERHFGDSNRIRSIMEASLEPGDLDLEDVDAFIILVNDPSIWAYSVTHGYNLIGQRNEQPIQPIIIQAPIGYDPEDWDFHKHVKTDAIAHEMGHAIARLQDEYTYSDSTRSYSSQYRNVSIKQPFKWQKLIDLDPSYATNDMYPASRDHRLGVFQGALYDPYQYYRPTNNSTMHGQAYSDDYQFGPVNTYHLEASFRTRLGLIRAQDPVCTDNPNSYEWEGYGFEEFMNHWRPYDFY